MKNIRVAIMMTTAAALLLASGPAAFAKGKAGSTPQNHHCMKEGADVTGKTKKQCLKDGGKWEKDAGAAKPTEMRSPDSPPVVKPVTK